MSTTTGAEQIAAERQRQIDGEGYTVAHDAHHGDMGALPRAAAAYALNGILFLPGLWPWDDQFWKPVPADRVRELVKAGALIAAEIDRLQAKATS